MKTLRGVGALALLAGCTLGGLAARAQAPAVTAPSKMYTNKQQFRLPFNLDDRERARLRDIQLFVRYNGDSWTCKETAPPAQKAFTYRAAQDGEYWFSIVTVDRTGKATPVDVAKEPPALIVVVDTQQPEVQFSTVSHAGVDCLRCEVHDANPDPSRVKLEYQTPDHTWRPVESVPGCPDLFRFPDKGSWTGQLRATATDRAENVGTREITWSTPAPVVEPVVATPGRVDTHSDKTVASVGPDLLPPPVRTSAMPVAGQSLPMATPLPPFPSQPLPSQPIQQVVSRDPVPTNPQPVIVNNHDAAPSREQGLANRQLLNSTHVVLNYRIDQVGPSGVSKVEVWMTADEGKTWQRLCEDPDRRSPAEFDLPREGLYGVSVVVTNGNSISDPPPSAGTVPDWWIEVDTTRPTAQLQSVRPGMGEDAGSLLITWAASDKNLGTEPVDLYYATSREGPWMAIQRGVRNDGTYRWVAPHDGVGRYYIRMDVTDRAGNLTRCETADAVVLDLTHPKARVLGASVSGLAPLTPPSGN
jgi:hypothetical protein